MRKDLHIELENLFSKHYDEWCLISYMYLKNRTEAEEVVQAVCVAVLLRESNAEILNLKAYISTAVRNGSLQKIKQLRKFELLNESHTAVNPSIEESLIRTEDTLHLQKVISALPEVRKTVFNLCVVEGQKYKTVADQLGVSVDTIKYHVKKAYKTLRVEMQNVHFLIIYSVISSLF